MAWNGSGLFSRIHNWVTDKGNAIDITASRMDADSDDFAAGITACLAKNGENTPTADLPMGGYNHTNVDDGTARTHYASVGQTQDGALLYAADSGAADAYVMTLSPAITAYAAGQVFNIKATNTNTGASTVNINGVSAAAIVDAGGSALVGGEIVGGQYYSLIYDGTSFRLTSLIASAARTALGLAIGSDVQAYDAGLAYLDGLNFTNEATFKAGANLEGGVDYQEFNAAIPTSVVSQAEAEAGIGTTNRTWTAERVSQAIAALSVPYTAQSKADSGYIKLTGGVVVQWGVATSSGTAVNNATVTLPVAFPTEGFIGVASISGIGALNNFTVQIGIVGTAELRMTTLTNGVIASAINVKWIAIGH